MPDARSKPLAWLASRPDFETRRSNELAPGAFSLERPRLLLERAGRPDLRLALVQVAGTKGKGSTAAFIAGILRAHGLRVGLYSQPHLQDLRERLRCAGELIGPAELDAVLADLRPLVAALDRERPDLGPATSYEIMTVAGLAWFAARRADWAVLEVGLGGRLDATTIVEPRVAVITPISYDHTQVLGRTLGAIAGEKAGIVKPGASVVSGPQRPAARTVLAAAARRQAARLVLIGRTPGAPVAERVEPIRLGPGERLRPGQPLLRLSVRSARAEYPPIELALGGYHQVDNALTAVAAVEATGLELEPAAVARGLAGTRWPGRFELVKAAPLVVLDGAHNGASALALRRAIELHAPGRLTRVLLGVFADKDLGAILRALRGVDELIALAAPGPRARPVDQIVAAARRLGLPVRPGGAVAETLAAELAKAGPDELLCVTGSLSVVAAARTSLGLAPG